ncbi:GNAT family N-acetyltransferase [Inquilinus sp. CAU 1745]|uniref:GNAT family N-acetyltransferase n=1 Tax=Inquilinus sp. CAU 1745 TaxID=3140369 RepID=UPI00325AA028
MVDLRVTYMEMTQPPVGPEVARPVAGARVERESLVQETYLRLYRAVGEPVQWDQRLRLTPEELENFLCSTTTSLHVLRLQGQPVGFCEFDGIGRPDIELTNFGLIPEAQGRKLGPYLLDRALRAIWSYNPGRIWLHTDTNDHPKAQATYHRAGFRIYREHVENFPD